MAVAGIVALSLFLLAVAPLAPAEAYHKIWHLGGGASSEGSANIGTGENGIGIGASVRIEAKADTDKDVPPGHFIAPGLRDKLGDDAPRLDADSFLPPGIARILDRLGLGDDDGADEDQDDEDEDEDEDEDDEIAPVISGLSVSAITHNSAKISFETGEDTRARLAIDLPQSASRWTGGGNRVSFHRAIE